MSDLTRTEIESLRQITAQLDALHSELIAAAKRNAAMPLSPFQLGVVNEVIEKANAALGPSRPFSNFAGFSEVDLPGVADASMAIAQYVECCEKLRCENIAKYHFGWVWRGAEDIMTVPPRK